MSLFGSIVDKLFHHAKAAQPAAASPQAVPQPSASAGSSSASVPASSSQMAPTPATSPAASQKLQNVDVEAVLTELASKKGGGGNWRTSVVDLLKMLDLDSSLSARKQLASELNVHAGADGTAEQNIALQKAVMSKIAENGGKVPDSLRH